MAGSSVVYLCKCTSKEPFGIERLLPRHYRELVLARWYAGCCGVSHSRRISRAGALSADGQICRKGFPFMTQFNGWVNGVLSSSLKPLGDVHPYQHCLLRGVGSTSESLNHDLIQIRRRSVLRLPYWLIVHIRSCARAAGRMGLSLWSAAVFKESVFIQRPHLHTAG